MLANTAADVAVIVIAVGIFGLCVWGSFVLYKLGLNLTSTKQILDGVKDEAVPILSEARTTLVNVNRELDRTDGILESAGNIAKSAERLSAVVEETVSSPLIKVVAFSAGIGKAFRRFVGAD